MLQGELLYIISDPLEENIFDVDTVGVVEPTDVHGVKPLGKVSFYVEFYP